MAADKKGRETQKNETTGTAGDTPTGEELEGGTASTSPVNIETEQEKPCIVETAPKTKTGAKRKTATPKRTRKKTARASSDDRCKEPGGEAGTRPDDMSMEDGTKGKVGARRTDGRRKSQGKDATGNGNKARARSRTKGTAKTLVAGPQTTGGRVRVEDPSETIETLGKVSEATRQGRNKPRPAGNSTGSGKPSQAEDEMTGIPTSSPSGEDDAAASAKTAPEGLRRGAHGDEGRETGHGNIGGNASCSSLPSFRDVDVPDATVPRGPVGCLVVSNAANLLDKAYLALSVSPIESLGNGYLRPIRVSDDTTGVHAPGYVALLEVDLKGRIAESQTGGMGGGDEGLTVISAIELPWARGRARLALMSFDSTVCGHIALIDDDPFRGVDFKAMSDAIGRAIMAAHEDRERHANAGTKGQDARGMSGKRVAADWDMEGHCLKDEEASRLAESVIGRDEWGRDGKALLTLASMIEAGGYGHPGDGKQGRSHMSWAAVRPDEEERTLSVFRVGRDGAHGGEAAPTRRMAGRVLGINVPWMGRTSVLAIRTDGTGVLVDIDPKLSGWRVGSLADRVMAELVGRSPFPQEELDEA